MKKRILIAPLDWGLGHATRCIPIVRALLAQGAEVVLASNGGAYDLLRREFPHLPIKRLPAYNIRYASENMFWNMAGQLPRIGRTVWREHQVVQNIIADHDIRAVISDNRFGCFSKKVPGVLLSHQLNIQIPNYILKKIVDCVICKIIHQFDECWIPDATGANSLAGKLAEAKCEFKIRYLGSLSRMRPLAVPKKYDAIAVLSGPEPQRTHLEQKILTQVRALPQRFLIVQGKTASFFEKDITENIKMVSFLTGDALNEAIAAAGCVICRSGYSSVMDLAALGQRAILIPTPGQTEQEYLAQRFFERGVFFTQQQSELDLRQALQAVQGFSGLDARFFNEKRNQLEEVVANFLRSL